MTAHATATADTAGLEPAPSHCVDTVVDAGALPIRAICPVILFWLGNLTQWWADRRPLLTVEVSGFGVAQTPTVFTGLLHHEVSAIGALKLLTSVTGAPVGNVPILAITRHGGGILSITTDRCYGVRKKYQGSHPLPAASCGIEKN